jgi:hypothetical protein
VEAGRGKETKGMARKRMAWLGKARRDKARHCVAREGKAWLVMARLG